MSRPSTTTCVRICHFGEEMTFKLSIPVYKSWSNLHQLPDEPEAPNSSEQGLNVMPDLANAMKINPNLKVQLNAGYFESRDALLPRRLRDASLAHARKFAEQHRIQVHYESGHMVYAKESSLKALHDNVAGFIRRTSNGG